MSIKNLAIFFNKVAGLTTYTGQNYVRIKESDFLDARIKTTATAASHQHLQTAPRSKRKEGKRNLE